MSTVMTYTNVNGYLIPNLTYKSGEQMEQLGKHLLEVDKAAREREEVILKQLEKKEPLPDKEKNQMAWVRAANQHKLIIHLRLLKIINDTASLLPTITPAAADNPLSAPTISPCIGPVSV